MLHTIPGYWVFSVEIGVTRGFESDYSFMSQPRGHAISALLRGHPWASLVEYHVYSHGVLGVHHQWPGNGFMDSNLTLVVRDLQDRPELSSCFASLCQVVELVLSSVSNICISLIHDPLSLSCDAKRIYTRNDIITFLITYRQRTAHSKLLRSVGNLSNHGASCACSQITHASGSPKGLLSCTLSICERSRSYVSMVRMEGTVKRYILCTNVRLHTASMKKDEVQLTFLKNTCMHKSPNWRQ